MTNDLVVAVIAILPQLLVIGVVGAVAVRYRVPLARIVDQRVSGISAFGLRVDLRPSEVDKAVRDRLGERGAGPLPGGVPGAGTQVAERARRMGARLVGRRVLWVDDHPEGNRVERRMLRQLGIFTEAVTTNDQAMLVLDDPAESIDVVITDLRRDDGSTGQALIDAVRARPNPPPVICYVLALRDGGGPPGAFGITSRPDALLDLVMDALDR